ncbi:dimethylarginine dimethylaminohydrolase family protein [Flavilitoribacter nigricans]|uniref:arginine deiminase n=1 Tax=Flavilitoribacter nigricans (strain ATCC 23147 / DSM 23189 / NBRC 102662 / NCIMB 1420 / SS-2) TaxID=1122177 RepID=A0A2D0NF35_FLAN2|nr:arginine deiminase family protein [Flavilitoribacter nigricans]PHN06789.1 hypothetical protein CRP01_10900 [Flavilitoribacter nigricans DSM 23189 = NBRC 102662]
MSSTRHSESGTLRSVLIKPVENAFLSPERIESEWAALNYLSPPDLERAQCEYAAFEAILRDTGAEIYQLPTDEGLTMDSVYCRDAAIATDAGMILCNMGKIARRHEPRALGDAFERLGIPVLGAIRSPGTLEGGDVAWLDAQTLAVGYTYRTNLEGIAQLEALLQPQGVQVLRVDLPHYRGPDDVFHLMSIFSPVAEDLAVVYSPLMPVAFREELIRRQVRLVEVPEGEFDSMGCNVLALAPRLCLMVEGNPLTQAELEKAGCRVITYRGEEISVKGGGGPTCLTRPIDRVRV